MPARLLGGWGLVASQPEAFAALERTFTVALPEAEWLSAIRTSGFFAPTSDPSVWRQGWWRSVAPAQLAASHTTPREEWWAAGTVPLLVIQGLDDKLAVPANGRALREEFGDRVQLIEPQHAGHAYSPSSPRRLPTWW